MIEAIERARAAIGTPFRLQGRTVGTGLDCLGLILHAFALTERGYPAAYGWRQPSVRTFLQVARSDFDLVANMQGLAGDVLLFDQGRHRYHLALATATGVIHADTRLRRVVERQGALELPLLAVHRFRPTELRNV